MGKGPADFSYEAPERRPMKIYSSDPLVANGAATIAQITVPNEPLGPGPSGRRLVVVDYDATNKVYYPPIDLDHPNVLMRGGLDPTESDPRFHQQMVYAVAMRTLENFDRALGRTVRVGRRGSRTPLRLMPHAFYGANAFYHRPSNAILFGYFRASATEPGENLPNQMVFSCLSHDIIAHEMTHAIVDRLRRYFLEPSNVDVLAFHEGFADLVALFQHFSFRDLLADQIQRKRTRIRERGDLILLARQFGQAMGSGQALRSALGDENKKLYDTLVEPHARGSILVAAVFDAFFAVYSNRIRDLIRIATGGTGNLPDADLHPDLVNRVAGEASRIAQSLLTACIRAFDYLPPVDITFSDYLRALVTADFEASPQDELGLRAAVVEAFSRRGIRLENVSSRAEESTRWAAAPSSVPPLSTEKVTLAGDLLLEMSSFSRDAPRRRAPEAGTAFGDYESDTGSELARSLADYAHYNRGQLHLHPTEKIEVHAFHPVFRVGSDGGLLVELVVQFAQKAADSERHYGGIPLRGGTTLIADAGGRVKYVISKPLPRGAAATSADQEREVAASSRERRQREYLQLADMADPMMPYYSTDDHSNRMQLRMSFASLHQGTRG
jgi:hypothetical protein